MTGLDVWHLIAPILAKNLPLDKSDEARDAYVIAYNALKNYGGFLISLTTGWTQSR